MAKPSEPLRRFAVRIQLYPGSTFQQMRELERRLEDYAEDHDIELSGHQLTYVVSSSGRSLTATDQVDLVDWLTGQDCISTMKLTPLRSAINQNAVEQGAYLSVIVCDMVTIGLKLLYRRRRISAELYLQTLGGFVRPVAD